MPAAQGQEADCSSRLLSLRGRHLEAAYEIDPADTAWGSLHRELASLESAVRRLIDDPASLPVVEDRLAGWGELLAVVLVAGALAARGVPALACLEPLIVVVGSGKRPGRAEAVPEMAMTRDAVANFLQRHRLPATGRQAGEDGNPAGDGRIVVVPGFIGRTVDGRVTTLGRGGSDYSATLLAAALGSRACWIYTDVDGVLTADPRIVPDARVLPRISAATAGRLSYCGARVLHPRSVAPAARERIELRVRNAFSPENAGTLIADADPAEMGDGGGAGCPRLWSYPVVVGRRRLCAAGLTGPGLAEIPHLFGRLCRVALSAGVEIVQAPQPVPGHDPLVMIDATDAAAFSGALAIEFELEQELRLVAGVAAQMGLALCSVVGDHLESADMLPGMIQALLAGAGIRWLHQSVSAEVVSFVVAESQLDSAIRCIHAALVGLEPGVGPEITEPGMEGTEPERQERVTC
jgi:aspartate kinase